MKYQLTTLKQKLGLVILSSLVVTSGCSDSDKQQTATPEGDYLAVVAAISPDYTSSEIAIADTKSPYTIIDSYAATADSDITVATYGEYFYRIGKYNLDNITRYHFDTPQLADWQFTTKDNPADTSSNPYHLIFVNDQKAYLIRYDAPKIWIVNPSVAANDEANFKLGEIDLSAYDSDAAPNAAAAILHDDRLFVAMQALQPDYSYGPAYLAVIDTTTDLEIDLDGIPANGKGMALSVQNPWDIDVQGDNIYVTGLGEVYAPVNPYNGGIEQISTLDYSSSLIVDDGGANQSMLQSTYVSDTVAYFVSAAADYFAFPQGNQLTSLYRFNPGTGAVAASPVTGLTGVDIQSLEVSPDGMVWVGVGSATAPQIQILDPNSNTVIDTIAMTMNPAAIAFSDNQAAP